MNKFSIAMCSVVAMGSAAMAQPTAKVDAKAGTKVDAKAGAPVAPQPPPPPPPPPAAPKPPDDIKAAIKAMGARRTCVGTGLGADMQMAEMRGTVTSKIDLDGWFVRQTINTTVGKGKTAIKMKNESLATFDTKLDKWRIIGVANDGSIMEGTAELRDGRYEMTAEVTGPMGGGMFRDHGDLSDPRVTKWWGEMSTDRGKTWTKVYEQTCK